MKRNKAKFNKTRYACTSIGFKTQYFARIHLVGCILRSIITAKKV